MTNYIRDAIDLYIDSVADELAHYNPNDYYDFLRDLKEGLMAQFEDKYYEETPQNINKFISSLDSPKIVVKELIAELELSPYNISLMKWFLTKIDGILGSYDYNKKIFFNPIIWGAILGFLLFFIIGSFANINPNVGKTYYDRYIPIIAFCGFLFGVIALILRNKFNSKEILSFIITLNSIEFFFLGFIALDYFSRMNQEYSPKEFFVVSWITNEPIYYYFSNFTNSAVLDGFLIFLYLFLIITSYMIILQLIFQFLFEPKLPKPTKQSKGLLLILPLIILLSFTNGGIHPVLGQDYVKVDGTHYLVEVIDEDFNKYNFFNNNPEYFQGSHVIQEEYFINSGFIPGEIFPNEIITIRSVDNNHMEIESYNRYSYSGYTIYNSEYEEELNSETIQLWEKRAWSEEQWATMIDLKNNSIQPLSIRHNFQWGLNNYFNFTPTGNEDTYKELQDYLFNTTGLYNETVVFNQLSSNQIRETHLYNEPRNETQLDIFNDKSGQFSILYEISTNEILQFKASGIYFNDWWGFHELNFNRVDLYENNQSNEPDNVLKTLGFLLYFGFFAVIPIIFAYRLRNEGLKLKN